MCSIAKEADVDICTIVTDWGSGCIKCAHFVPEVKEICSGECLFCFFTCGNHDSNLVETAVTGIVPGNFIASLFSICKFVGMGDHQLRLQQRLAKLIKERIVFRDMPESEATVDLGELMAMILALDNRFSPIRKITEGKEAQVEGSYANAARQRKAAWENAIAKCRVTVEGQIHAMCPPSAGREQMREEIAANFSQAAMPRALPVPALNKWTRLLPCAVWFVPLFILQVLDPLFDDRPGSAFEKFAVQDAQYGDMSYHKVEGVLFKRAKVNVCGKTGGDFIWRLMLLLMVLEPMSEVTMFFLRSAHQFVEAPWSKRSPPLCDLVSPKFSVILAVRQYMAFLLRGGSTRLRLLYARQVDGRTLTLRRSLLICVDVLMFSSCSGCWPGRDRITGQVLWLCLLLDSSQGYVAYGLG